MRERREVHKLENHATTAHFIRLSASALSELGLALRSPSPSRVVLAQRHEEAP